MNVYHVAGAAALLRRFALPTVTVLLLLLLATGCALDDENEAETEEPAPTPAASATESAGVSPGMGMGRGMGPSSGMRERHQAPIPAEYASLISPVEATEESVERGGEIYVTNCATCHGDGGMGDGPTGANLDPVPAPIAHTSQMMGDNYLFWRISEGGAMAPFNSAMPAWKDVLDEEQRWDVSNYVRALGAGTVTPRAMMGGAMYDPAAEQAQLAAMLETAVEENVITQTEADTFMEVHTAIDGLMASGMSRTAGNMQTMQQAMLNQLVNSEAIMSEQAATFNQVHDKLVDAGLMQ
jgi:mono/diheme cytochrome c family protein